MKSIEITTAHNIVIEYELASMRERATVFMGDFIAILVLKSVIDFFLSLFFGRFFDTSTMSVLSFITLISCFFGYFIGFEIFNNGQTLAKKIAKIRTVRLDGREPSWSDLLGRTLLHLVDSIFSLGFIGILMIKTTQKSQRLGDLAAGTTVIRLEPSISARLSNILHLDTTNEWTPIYPQVRRFREEDMITIKNVLSRYSRFPNNAHYNLLVELSEKTANLLEIEQIPSDRLGFLRTLLKDYVVLTR
jgi:uncharacterized RDD family membrane protein YckC